jgi:hypothetical protein
VKFRCERDVLTDALGTCGRAVGARSSSLPVLAGTQLQLTGDTLRLTGTDLELAITIDLDVAGAEHADIKSRRRRATHPHGPATRLAKPATTVPDQQGDPVRRSPAVRTAR